MEKLQWKTEVRKLSDLIPVSYNPRSLSDKQAKDLKKSLLKFNLAEIPVINLDNTILAGHQRCKILAQIEGKDFEIDVRVPNRQLTPEDADEYLIRSNKNSGEFDFELLENHFSTEDLVDWGFDEDEFEHDVDDLGEVEGEDDVPDVPEEPVTKLGDVWILGSHRLLCGDATSIDAVDKLMDGQKVDLVFTDPPYGINHSGKGIDGANKASDFGSILGDDDIAVAVDAFNLCQASFPDSRMIFWGANYYSHALPSGFGWLVWDKQREGDTFSGAELAFVNKGTKVDVFRHQWHGMIKASEHGQARVHPMQKPIALAEWCFENYGDKCVNILDLFGGSGSTLIACEKTKRKCFMMELDPKYCDVIVKRWQEFTKKEAVHAESGKKYNELLHQA